MSRFQDKCRGSLVGGAVGDAPEQKIILAILNFLNLSDVLNTENRLIQQSTVFFVS